MDYTFDAKHKTLGRLASQIATILQGKHKASFDPRLEGTDRVIVKNANGIVVTGRKATQKIYYRHSGPLGHLKERKYKDVSEKNPSWALRNAVRLMLPKNRLRAKRLNRLIFSK